MKGQVYSMRTVAIIFLVLALLCGSALFLPSREIVVKPEAKGPALGSLSLPTGTVAAASGSVTDMVDDAGSFIMPRSTPSYVVVPQTPIDTVSYDAKVLAIAHLASSHATAVPAASSSVSTSTSTITVRAGSTLPFAAEARKYWPVPISKAPYPIAGAILPFDRIVAYYGNFYSKQMGVLGQYPPDQVMAMLASTTAAWAVADPTTPVVAGIDYIAVTAQGSAGADGMYRLRMPPDQIEQAIAMAAEVNGVVILDVQVGKSTVEKEVPLLESYLKLPQVELALDPEFSMSTLGKAPGTVIGTMDASDINWAAQYLASLVQQNNLPPKILIVHRFTQAMVTHSSEIAPLPAVQIVMDMDGFGSPSEKFTTYHDYIMTQPVQFTGVKLFYYNDSTPSIGGHLLTPSEVLRLSPQPSFIQYQ